MKIAKLPIKDCYKILFKPNKDGRGYFTRTYCKKEFKKFGVNDKWVQNNLSFNKNKSTLRGLHFQTPPFAQDKLVRVVKGSILDVAVDIRKNSPYYGKHVSIVLSADNWKQILVPVGFAHGFLTLEENTEVIYKVTNFYSPENDRGVIWNDKDLAIDWGIPEKEIILSEKDEGQPSFSVLGNYFP